MPNLNPAPKKPHTAGILAALVTIGGIVTSPVVAGLLPGKYAAAITAAGALLQAFTKPVHAGDTDVVPKTTR
jgi:hypothetical protein